MADVYRIVRPDGRVEYTDMPGGPGTVEKAGQGGKREESPRPVDHKTVVSVIKEVQKRIPKLNDYLDYIDYLRYNNPRAFAAVMKELERTDIKTYLALQKYPQFRPLGQSLVGLKAGERTLALGAGLATGGVGGSVEKWLEGTVKELMQRDRWGPYAKVLGSRASTLPAPPAPTYSSSRLGQYLKEDDLRRAAASKDAASMLEKSRAGMRAARGTAVTRGLGPLVDLGIGALDPDFFRGISAIRGRQLANRLVQSGILSPEEGLELPGMMARGEFEQVNAMIQAAVNRAGENR